MKKLAGLVLSLFLTTGIALADTPKEKDADPKPAKAADPAKPKAAKKAEKADSAIAAEIEELRQALQSQQEQLQLLKEELAKRDRQIDEAREAAASANARASEASAKAAEAVSSTAEIKSTATALNTSVSDLKTSTGVLKTTVDKEQAEARKMNEEGQASIQFKGITITPGGFLAAESVWRQRSAQADVNTPFTGTPFPNNAFSKVSEFNASGRQSRLSFLFEGKADVFKATGYYELDWLGACVTSNSRQSNSYCMRQRQIWGQVATPGGWAITGGQMWSLATETRKGLDNRTEATPLTVDAQYNVGFVWARQYGVRVTKSFNDKVWVGLSVEEPQVTFGGRGSPTGFFVGGAGAGGGLLNFIDTTGYSANVAPDFIVKAAFEPGWGHYEVFGILSNFRARVYPCSANPAAIPLPAFCPGTTASAAGAFNDTRTGGGVGVSLRGPVIAKKLDVGVHFLGGDGVGRYSSAQLADVTARPDGTLAPIRGGSALGTIEFHPNAKWDVYLDYGIEYAYRTKYAFTNVAGATVAVGYGSPLFNNSGCENGDGLPTGTFAPNTANGTCNGDIRNIQEGTFGFWNKLYSGPKGGVRWGIQYSYIFKNTWSGSGGLPAGTPGINAKAVDNMVFTSFRYYIP